LPGTPPPRPIAGSTGSFPTPEELERLGEPPPAESLFDLDVRPVEEWRLAGPFPARIEDAPWSEGTPWSRLLSEVAAQRAGLVVPTEAMHCVARELGRFFLAQRGRPAEGLRRFILSRCHATAADVAASWLDGAVPESAGEEEVFGHWRKALDAMLAQGMQGGPRSVGIWFGREAGHAVALVAYGRREVLVEPFSPFATEAGDVEFRGEVLAPVARVGALVNRGRFGVAACEPLGAAPLPRFHFRCRVERGDAAAHIALTATAPERLLARTALSVLAWPGAQTLDVYRAPRYAEPRPVETPQALGQDLVDLLNRVRREADLAPVRYDAEQSRSAAQLAPHFFGAMHGETPGLTADLVVLGMIAGWGVEGVVESGHFSAAWVAHTSDLSRLLSDVLEYPGGREALLAESIDRVAVGPLFDGTPGRETLAAVFGTYSLFSAEEHEAIVGQIHQKLERDRRERGQGPARRLEALDGPCQRAAGLVHSGGEPADAMGLLLRDAASVLRAPVSGWVAEVRELDALEFPLEYLTSPTLRVAVAVSHKRREGEPWGHYVVMLVVSDPEAWGA
jgi:hypothetical protein